ncbi:MAG TPA: glycine cleavage system aminomethyltransferase GcvT [Acidimicrobiia bacterium]|nr:glycine cleavage system aminomethyltransferase GcvT [Acidimicrobiia bacterium]
MPDRRSPLDGQHRALGARMVPFGGWDMPIQYEGVLEEHRRCRSDAVVFDVSHLGSVVVRGDDAFDALQGLFTNDLRRVAPGRAQYTHLLDPDDAHVVDDIIVWWLDDEDFLVIPNASNTGPALDAMRGAVGAGGEVRDVTGERTLLAVQGPNARTVLGSVVPEAASVSRFHVASTEFGGHQIVVGGTGYTGEDGVELHVPNEAAADVWDALLAAGATPAGLGARDTLRLEMGYPLHGHELGPGITPLQAGLGWVVGWEKGDFRGRAALEAERERGVERLLTGVIAEGRQIPRQGCTVMVDGKPVGEVTSGNFSPTLERGIGLALLPPDLDPATPAEIDVRGRTVSATVSDLPFVHRVRET